ncbi:hypothetical protein VIBNISFn27_180015 [Vibrio nigripulchritudo SFn27]|uniref:Uncharacterized protein n=1 Tax=Vibrio nigripulchritudo TaxID=28173 RepID=U4KIJ0_9VIBR|nr:hypothetical protein [Vibrio nigripulchritudo]CCN80750.1 hypothetical protein VIBNIBLFn1_110029 [Vibrio nigripulchritudo BLFn1]CCN87838.1 hypothetical protein VIBNISFn27_180015 [Vibrio nigripulchritudo SFn27]CCN93733.1 hypothetical protein VIBNIENn2_300029 [Vibrio nigripulchritudo ENn2]CCO43104.1 hypothetical protein VIBNISFn135_920029 [Vibrio nigripulchritudo SFn135]CCO52521.1 hypothetical protein VIBNIWn13_340015 [Vibrio nigripulchritudo Wn13]
MKMKSILALTVSTFLSVSALAKPVHVLVENVTNSPLDLIAEMVNMEGPVEATSGERALYASENHQVAVLDSSIVLQQGSSLEKERFNGVKAVVIVGSPKDNMQVSQALLGYGVEDDYIVITGVDEPKNIALTYFTKVDTASDAETAKALIKAAIK